MSVIASYDEEMCASNIQTQIRDVLNGWRKNMTKLRHIVVWLLWIVALYTAYGQGWRGWSLHGVGHAKLDILKLFQAEPLSVNGHAEVTEVNSVLGTSDVLVQHLRCKLLLKALGVSKREHTRNARQCTPALTQLLRLTRLFECFPQSNAQMPRGRLVGSLCRGCRAAAQSSVTVYQLLSAVIVAALGTTAGEIH